MTFLITKENKYYISKNKNDHIVQHKTFILIQLIQFKDIN